MSLGIPKADFSPGGSGTRAGLPFSTSELSTPGSDDVLVFFKVCGSDEEMTRRVAALITRQMEGQRVGERGISVIISDESVEMSVTTKQEIANKIAPLVAAALGVTIKL